MFYSDNPIADASAYYEHQERQLAQLPKCAECGEPIQDEHAYEIGGEYFCEDCMIENHRVWVSDIMSQS